MCTARFTKATLEQMIAALDAQTADVKTLLYDLPIGGSESNAAGEWLEEATKARDQYRQLLRECEG